MATTAVCRYQPSSCLCQVCLSSSTKNSYQVLKLVNGANYKALDVILDKAYPGHRISADSILHFGPPAGILLAAESTEDFSFVGMPPGTILLTPLSSKLECVRRRPWQRHDITRR
ncbi:hypothetical protein IQ07DRAFT_669274 [Pyrenochaeta sp. DS3sAY3a]|nr:hypothetical protein IQ07DRAFT_669274 [Pyrenochaeta sp. DS3sAY3a]